MAYDEEREFYFFEGGMKSATSREEGFQDRQRRIGNLFHGAAIEREMMSNHAALRSRSD